MKYFLLNSDDFFFLSDNSWGQKNSRRRQDIRNWGHYITEEINFRANHFMIQIQFLSLFFSLYFDEWDAEIMAFKESDSSLGFVDLSKLQIDEKFSEISSADANFPSLPKLEIVKKLNRHYASYK